MTYRYGWILVVPLLVLLTACGNTPDADTSALNGQSIDVAYSPSCTCCKNWVGYLEENGMAVDRRSMSQSELNMVKAEHNLQRETQSCHTATIDGYVVEGHVPAEAIAGLLERQPDDIKGITVPGMPRHSPGMGQPIGQNLPIYSIDKDGSRAGTFMTVEY